MDCERVYGRILDCKIVESSVCAESKDMSRKIWSELYPEEPFELDYSKISSQKYFDVNAGDSRTITYDLIAAVQRQSSFYYQVG
jgi:Glycine-rich domain-containing protein-like